MTTFLHRYTMTTFLHHYTTTTFLHRWVYTHFVYSVISQFAYVLCFQGIPQLVYCKCLGFIDPICSSFTIEQLIY